LTKRPERIAANLPDDWGEGYPNVWLGTSVESQDYAESRLPHLMRVPAIVRFLSCEPLLGAVSLRIPFARFFARPGTTIEGVGGVHVNAAHGVGGSPVYGPIHWIIVGGESGPNARPMREEWAASLRDECARYGVAFFLKQLGGFPNKRGHDEARLDGRRYVEMPAAPVPSEGPADAR
jgi:protein gp37